MSKFRVWYDDKDRGLCKIELSKESIEEAERHFNTYYRKFRLINIIQLD